MLLLEAGAPAFLQNYRIDLPDETYVIVDFYWPELRAVLEIDSVRHHHERPGDIDRTDDKHVALETLGLSVIHRTPGYIIRQPSAFTAGVLAWLEARRRDLA
jgi:very-short-patch-repair endonuclease